MTKRLLLLATASLALAACKSMSYDQVTTSLTGGGVTLVTAPAPSITAGYAQTRTSVNPAIDQKGNAITEADSCGAQHSLDQYSILHGSASTSAHTTNGGAVSIAVDEGQATGEAAVEMAMAQVAQAVGGGYDIERAHRDCSHVK